SRYRSAVVRDRAQQSSGDSLQSAPQCYAALPPDYERGRNVQNTDDQAGSEDCAKRLKVFHAIVAKLTQESGKSGSKRNNRDENARVAANPKICAAPNTSDCQAFKSVTLIGNAGMEDRHFVSFPVFLDSRFVVISYKKCLRPFDF